MSETARYLKISRPNMGFFIDELAGAKAELEDTIEGGEPGEIVSFEVVEMTPAEYEALPEFEGW